MVDQEYDVRFTLSGTDYGFMLVQPAGQSKQLNFTDAPPSQEGHKSDTTYEAFGGQLDTAMEQSGYIAGLGQLEMADPRAAWWGKNVVIHTDGKVYLAPPVNSLTPTSNTTAMGGFYTYYTGSTRYDFCWASNRLYRRDASNITNAWVVAYTAANAISDFVIIDDVAFICTPTIATTTDYFTQTAPSVGSAWTPTAVTTFAVNTPKPKFFRQIRGYTFAFCDPNTVYSSVTSASPTWVGPINTSLANHYSGAPGDTTYAFQNVYAVNDMLLVFKAEAAYNIDAQQEITQVIWQWANRPDPNNFKHITTMGDLVVYSMGHEVWVYNPNTGQNISMLLDMASGFSIQSIRGLGADSNFVYVGAQVRVPTLRSASTFALFRCWRTTATRWSCEVIFEDTTEADPTKYYNVFACPAGTSDSTRVYFGYDNATNVVTKFIDCLPNYDGSTGVLFNTTGQLYTSNWKGNWPTFTKRWLWIGTYTEGCDANNTIALAYSTDLGTTWTTIGTIAANGLAITDLSGPPASNSLALRFTFTSAGTVSPVLRVYDLHARPRWRHLETATMALRLGDYATKLSGAKDTKSASELLANLLTLRRSDGAITFQTFMGHSFTATIESVSYQPTTHELPEGQNEMMAMVTIAQASGGS